MSRTTIFVPQTNVNDESILIVEWHIEDGVWVENGDLIVTVETSKAAEEIYTDSAGHIFILAAIGDELPIGAALAYLSENPAGDSEKKISTGPVEKKVNATAKAHTLADANEIDLETLGIKGIITVSHVRKEIEKKKAENDRSPVLEKTGPKIGHSRELTRHQQATARAVLMSQKETASTYLQGEANVTLAEIRLRELTDKCKIPISMTDLILYVTARVLREFPRLNGTLNENMVSEFADVNVGIAIEINNDLVLVPLQNTDKMGIVDIAVKRMEATMNIVRGSLKANSLLGGTFTVSVLDYPNLSHHVPILYPGQSGILGAGTVRNIAAPDQNDGIKFDRSLGLTISYDHRHINGGYAASFLQKIADGLATPDI